MNVQHVDTGNQKHTQNLIELVYIKCSFLFKWRQFEEVTIAKQLFFFSFLFLHILIYLVSSSLSFFSASQSIHSHRCNFRSFYFHFISLRDLFVMKLYSLIIIIIVVLQNSFAYHQNDTRIISNWRTIKCSTSFNWCLLTSYTFLSSSIN